MINYQFVNTFLKVYRLGSQTKAAAALHLTQPAVFQQIRFLENQIGRPLFTRVGKHIQPTNQAHQLALKVAPHLEGIEQGWKGVSESPQSMSGVVYVGGVAEFFSSAVLPHIDAHLAQEIEIRFEIGYAGLAEKLTQGELDLAQFVGHVVYPGVETEFLFEQSYILVGHPKWKDAIDKAQLDKKNVQSLEKIPWLAYDESLLFIRDYYREVFDQSFLGNIRLMSPDLWSIKAAAVGGLGITILPSYFCEKEIANKRLAILYEPKRKLTHWFYLGWKVGGLRSAKVAMVRDAIRSALPLDSRKT